MAAWDRAKLGDLVETQKGYAFKSGWYCNAGRPIVKVSDFTDDAVDSTKLMCIPESTATDYLKYELRTGDVVVQTVGSWPTNPASVVGKCVRIPGEAAGALLNQNAVKLTPAGKFDRTFLFYLLRNEDFKTYIISTAQGAASQAAITLEAIRGYEFSLPPLPIQRRIAGILSAYDELIENSQRRIKILESMARGLYREWFVHFRFPGHESVPRVPSPLGEIPKGWEVVSIDDVCSRVTDGSHRSPPSVDDGMPMASSKDMHDWGLNLDTARLIGPEDFADLVRNDCKPKKNDVLITKDGANYLKYIFVTRAEQEVVLLSSVAMLRPNARINPHLLVATLKEPENKGKLKNYVTGAAIPRVILKDFKRFQLLLPGKEVQMAWAKVAEPMTEQIWRLIDTIQNLRRTRDLLLPRLLSGQIDVEAIAS